MVDGPRDGTWKIRDRVIELRGRVWRKYLLCLLGKASPTVVVALRHADIDLPMVGTDPSLNDAGEARAELLVDIFRDAGVRAVFATEFRRTQETAQPLAHHLGLTVQVRSSQEMAVPTLAGEILRDHRGQLVVVVGHSNTVPLLAAELGAPWNGVIGEADFDNLLWVTVACNGKRTVHHLHY